MPPTYFGTSVEEFIFQNFNHKINMSHLLEIDPINAQKAYNAGGFSAKIQNLVTSYADACNLVGIQPLTISDFSYVPEEDQEATYAYHQITIIARALNQGWKPDYSNGNETKYYPYFIWSDSAAGGPGFSYDDFRFDNSCSFVGARLVFKSEDLAEYAGKQFVSIYNQFLKN
jgi:hypothetical protein